jgi:hypothetical protein
MTAAPGDVAQRRHPRAGTGTGGYGYHGRGGYGHGGYGYKGHYGGYGYRGYKGYYPYSPYYYPYAYYNRPYVYGSIYWGWPYYYSWPYYAWPYYASVPYASVSYTSVPYSSVYYGDPRTDVYPEGDAPTGYAPEPDYEGRASETDEPPPDSGRRPDITLLGESGQLHLEVRPDDASVYVDDEFRGSARDLRQLTLATGRHVVELVRPGFGVERREIEVAKGQRADLIVELQRP